jgi:hypothetical protein
MKKERNSQLIALYPIYHVLLFVLCMNFKLLSFVLCKTNFELLLFVLCMNFEHMLCLCKTNFEQIFTLLLFVCICR